MQNGFEWPFKRGWEAAEKQLSTEASNGTHPKNASQARSAARRMSFHVALAAASGLPPKARRFLQIISGNVFMSAVIARKPLANGHVTSKGGHA
jgi:hypothetical protein